MNDVADWSYGDEVVSNKLGEINNISVLVDVKYLDKLKEFNIPYWEFSDSAKECYFVRAGVKPKRFGVDEVDKIKQDNKNGLSYRKLAKKYKCSTATIYSILSNRY